MNFYMEKNSIMIKQSFKSYTNISGVAALEWRAASVSIATLYNSHPTLFQINSIHCGRVPFSDFGYALIYLLKYQLILFITRRCRYGHLLLCRHRRYCRCRCIILPPHSRHLGTFIRWRYFHFRFKCSALIVFLWFFFYFLFCLFSVR